MKKTLVTKSARKDLHEIWHYIAADNVDAATKVCDAIQAGIARIAEMPGIGHPRRDVANPNYRFWKVYSYLIAYRFHGETLVISRIVHTARDMPHIFKR